MINALKLVSLNRGYDPRDFTLVAFGGGGGMHAVALAAELGIGKVIVPAPPTVFSAWGMLMTDLRRDYFVTRLFDSRRKTLARLERSAREVEDAALPQFGRDGIERRQRVRFFATAGSATRTRNTASRWRSRMGRTVTQARSSDRAEFHDDLRARVHLPARQPGGVRRRAPRRHRRGREADAGAPFPSPDARSATPSRAAGPSTTPPRRARGRRSTSASCWSRGWASTGPAIVETTGTTIVVLPGNELAVDAYGRHTISLGTEGR